MESGEKKELITKDIGKYPLKHKWDFRTGSPQRVYRAISDALEDIGYDIEESQPPELKSSPITDTATFLAEVIARKKEFASIRMVILGICLILIGVMGIYKAVLLAIPIFTHIIKDLEIDWTPIILSAIWWVVAFPIIAYGISLISAFSQKRVLVRIEGEVYKAASKIREDTAATDVICDTRLTVAGGISTLFWFLDRKGRDSLETDFMKIKRRFEAVLPYFRLP